MILLLLLLLDPAEAAKNKTPPPPPERPAPTVQAEPPPSTPGSLFSEVAARQLMGLDGNARQVGDLVTVRIVEESTTSLGADTRTSRESKSEAEISALLGAETSLLEARPAMGESIRVGGSSGSSFDGSGTTTRDATIAAVLTCQVIEVLPGGNLKIWGWKQVRVNREIQYVVLEGIARPRDITLDNTISSSLLAEARIEVTGTGVVADKQGPGPLARALDHIWPF